MPISIRYCDIEGSVLLGIHQENRKCRKLQNLSNFTVFVRICPNWRDVDATHLYSALLSQNFALIFRIRDCVQLLVQSRVNLQNIADC